MRYFGKIKEAIKPIFIPKSGAKQNVNDGGENYDELRPGSRLWLFLLFLSSTVILIKYLSDYGSNHTLIYKTILEINHNLIKLSYEMFAELFTYIWLFILKFHWLFIPSIFAFSFVIFSWIVLYKDSNIPGVSPPTPFSPSQHRKHCERSMDFSYALTGAFGLLIFLRLLYQSLRDSD